MKPRSVERVPVRTLLPHERKELEAILASTDPALRDRFHSDEGDSAAWWILLLLAALGGAGACGTYVLESDLEGLSGLPRRIDDYGLINALRGERFLFGLIACLAVAGWWAWTWVRNHGRRGFVSTTFATLRLKGDKLALLRHADVARIEWTRHVTRTQRFSVIDLTAGDGRLLRLYVHAGWVRVAIAQIDQARSAAGLPPIAGDARKLPESA